MSPLLSGINLALNALLAQQQAIEVTEHNVANANTDGYHRQEAVLTTGMPYTVPTMAGQGSPGQMGTGVMVDQIRRFTVDFFDGRYRNELSESKRWSIEGDVLQQVETTMGETGDDSLASKLNDFWNGWQALSSDPGNTALRSDVLVRANALADGLNWRAKALINLQSDQNLAINQRVDEVNTTADQIANLNVEIAHVKAAGDAPNDLLDQRDQLIDRLSEITGATANFQDNGEAIVSIGGHALVTGSTTFKLQAQPDPLNNNLTAISWADGNQPFNAQKGELAGLLDARDNVIPAQLDSLNQLANGLATRVNELHSSGYGLNNQTGLDFFAPFTTSNYALEIHVNSAINEQNIATAASSDSPGDGSLAGAIANVQSELLMNGGTTTLNQFYTGKVGELGLQVKDANQRATDRGSVADSMQQMKESATGVNLDEEAANLVKYQHAYQAAARLMTTMDQMLDTVINNMGLVGR